MNIQKIKVSNVDHVQPVKVNNAQQIIINMDLQDKVVIPTQEQQVIKPDIDFDALSKVIVEPIPDYYTKVEGTFDITKNGEYDIKSYAGVNVAIQPNLGTKTIDKNGIYNANDDNLDGYESVIVETSGVDINEYFLSSYTTNYLSNYSTVGAWLNFVRILPRVEISNMTNLNYLFSYCRADVIDASGVSTTGVTNMSYMFYFCDKVLELDLSHFDTSKVTNMSYMFSNVKSLRELDLSHFDTSKLTNIRNMFTYCEALESLNLKNWNTSNVTTARNMFSDCYKLEKLDLSHFDVSQVLYLQSMFYNCKALTELNLSNWQLPENVDTSAFLYNCSSLTKLIIDSSVVFPIKAQADINNSGITSGICNIYVPDDLVEAYNDHTVWGLYPEQIKGMSELITE